MDSIRDLVHGWQPLSWSDHLSVVMSGPAESPPTASPGTGSGLIIIDSTANTLNIVSETFSGLTSGTTASHIHCCTAVAGVSTAGVATQVPTFSGFPLGVTSGSYSLLFDMTQASTWNLAFITASGGTPAGAEAALVAGALIPLISVVVKFADSSCRPLSQARWHWQSPHLPGYFLYRGLDPSDAALAALGGVPYQQ